MPYDKGVCIPPMCVSLEWDQTKMVLTYFDTQKGKVVPRPLLWAPADETTALAGLMPTSILDCDGCTCWHPIPNPPWVAVPALQANHPIVVNYKVVLRVAGLKVRQKLGICLPPGTKIKGPDGKFRPPPGAGEKSTKPPKKKKS